MISIGRAAANVHGDGRTRYETATASVLGDALGIAGRQVFHRYCAVRADWRPFWLDGMRVEATGG